MNSVTVFVKKIGMPAYYNASTMTAEATHPRSALLAARACAARNFNVPEARIAVEPVGHQDRSGVGLMIATVMPPRDPRRLDLLVIVVAAALCAGIAIGLWAYFHGGAP